MSYKVFLWGSKSPIEWSQAAWRLEGESSPISCEHEMVCDVLRRHLPQDGRIVDAGCGSAKWPIYLRAHGYRCVGVDVSLDACRLARTLDAGLPVVQADTQVAPLRKASADVVLSFGVVEHDEAGPLAGLRELRRILKVGGLLVLTVPFDNLSRRLVVNHVLSYVTWRRRRASMRLGFVEYRFTKRELRRFLRETGFEPVAAYPNDLRPPWVVGPWVDYENLFFNPVSGAGANDLFVLPGLKGRVARTLLRWFPWFVCGEVVFLARAR